jgi:hypothetical protein
VFSHVRYTNRDTDAKLCKEVLSHDMKRNNDLRRTLRNNKMYSSAEMGPNESISEATSRLSAPDGSRGDLIFGYKDSERKNEIDKLLQERKEVLETLPPTPYFPTLELTKAQHCKYTRLVQVRQLLETSMEHSTTFTARLLQSEEFQATAAIATLGGSYEWFKSVIVFDHARVPAFERLCQYINQLLLDEYIEGMLERTTQLGFYDQLMVLLQQRRLNEFFTADEAASCWNDPLGLSFLVHWLGRLMLANVRRAFLARWHAEVIGHHQ